MPARGVFHQDWPYVLIEVCATLVAAALKTIGYAKAPWMYGCIQGALLITALISTSLPETLLCQG